MIMISMKNFDWNKFKKENIVVHCKTEEEANDFCREMHKHGMRWNEGRSYLEKTEYYVFKEATCYSGSGNYCYYDYYKRIGYIILEWSDYMRKEFTKTDLKSGMVVEQANKVRYLLVGDRALCFGRYNALSQYENDLTSSLGAEYGIEKVFKVKDKCVNSIEEIFDDNNLELVWESKETKRMTVEEMRQKLEELTGEKIIVKQREELINMIVSYCSGRLCLDCELCNIGKDCNFEKYTDEQLEQCYEKIMEDGRN